MNKEYTRIGDKILVRDEKGHLHTRKLYNNVDKILLKENRLEVIDSSINEEFGYLQEVEMEQKRLNSSMYKNIEKIQVIFIGMVAFTTIAFIKERFPFIDNLLISISEFAIPIFAGIYIQCNHNKKIKELNFEKKHTQIIINLYEKEKEYEQDSLEKLKKEKLGLDNNLVKDETLSVSDDSQYMLNLIDKADIAYNYAENEQKLLKLNKEGKLDSYLDKIGCREEDKSIYKDLLGINNENKKNKPSQKCK